jgi:hypothetical protein
VQATARAGRFWKFVSNWKSSSFKSVSGSLGCRLTAALYGFEFNEK